MMFLMPPICVSLLKFLPHFGRLRLSAALYHAGSCAECYGGFYGG